MSLSSCVRLAALATLLAVYFLSRTPAAADDAVGGTPVLSTPIPATTLPIATPVPLVTATALLPTSTIGPALAQENSTPIVTSIPLPTALPTSMPVATSDVAPTPTAVTTTPSGTPVEGVQASNAPWLSPAELRMNARLQWGDQVPSQVRRWAYLIVPTARKYHLNPNLIAAVMTMESNGDPLALSGSDARGLMQVLHGPWDPAANVDTGARMLAELYAQFGTWPLALAAYNAGPGAVLAYNGVPPYRETRDYVIIVSYLFDLFNHQPLSSHRRTQYRSTVADLRHFADQRKKVARLAKIAHVTIDHALACHHFSSGCGEVHQAIRSADPFWPVAGSPDPLQHVNPYSASGQ